MDYGTAALLALALNGLDGWRERRKKRIPASSGRVLCLGPTGNSVTGSTLDCMVILGVEDSTLAYKETNRSSGRSGWLSWRAMGNY